MGDGLCDCLCDGVYDGLCGCLWYCVKLGCVKVYVMV